MMDRAKGLEWKRCRLLRENRRQVYMDVKILSMDLELPENCKIQAFILLFCRLLWRPNQKRQHASESTCWDGPVSKSCLCISIAFLLRPSTIKADLDRGLTAGV